MTPNSKKKVDWFVLLNTENKALAVYGAELEEEARAKTKELLQQFAFNSVRLVKVHMAWPGPSVNQEVPVNAIKRQIYVSILGPEDYSCTAESAPKIAEWIKNRGGIAIWKSINLSNPAGSWTAPYLDDKGAVKGKPTWEADEKPSRVITDPAEVYVTVPKEVKRFHVAVRMGGQGMSLKLTDASSKKVEEAVAKEGIGAWYAFDYGTQEAVIFVAEQELRLGEFLARQAAG